MLVLVRVDVGTCCLGLGMRSIMFYLCVCVWLIPRFKFTVAL